MIWRTKPKWNEDDNIFNVNYKFVNCRLVDITITLNTCDTSFGRRSTATKADRRVKLPSLLAMEIRTDDSYSSVRQRICCYWRWWLHHSLVQDDVSSTKVVIPPHQYAWNTQQLYRMNSVGKTQDATLTCDALRCVCWRKRLPRDI